MRAFAGDACLVIYSALECLRGVRPFWQTDRGLQLEEITAARLPALLSDVRLRPVSLALRSLTSASGEEFPPEVLRQKVE